MTTTILAGKYPQNISRDSWLSEVMGKDAFRVTLDETFVNYPGILNVQKLHKNVFFYAKVAVDDAAGIRFLQDQGYSLVDTNVVFEKSVEKTAVTSKDFAVRMAKAEDKEKVKALAGSSFRYSRFHLDPAIAPAMASKIKAEWAGNFFEGKRGQAMIVAQKGSEIVGFLQLLDDKAGTITIDLIGVDEKSRKQGAGAAMIAFVQAQSPAAKSIVVGTQIVNTPSIRCYEKLGFRQTKASYVFHYHG